jgi:hypothetical protein
MAKQKVRKYKNKSSGGARYARTEQELYEKAVMLLDKCRIGPRS